MNNDASSYGAGVGTGIALGTLMRKDAKDEARRKSNEGEDQILIQLKKGSFDKAVKIITDMYDLELTKDGEFMVKNHSYNYGGFVLVFGVLTALLSITEYIKITNFGWIWGMIIVVSISAIVVRITRDTIIDWLEIDDEDGIALIQINKYDSSGYRNVDEKDIFRLIEKLREADVL